MINDTSLQLDTAIDCIKTLQNLRKEIYANSERLDQGLLQQFLDERGFYIKQITRVIGDTY